MKLVEVIRGQKTSDQTVATAVAYVKRLGKMPIVCNDGPGFLVNRLLLPYMNEALELVLEGAEIKTVEKASKNFGMPMGPVELYDMVGLDTAVFAAKSSAMHSLIDSVGTSCCRRWSKRADSDAKRGPGSTRMTTRKRRLNPIRDSRLL